MGNRKTKQEQPCKILRDITWTYIRDPKNDPPKCLLCSDGHWFYFDWSLKKVCCGNFNKEKVSWRTLIPYHGYKCDAYQISDYNLVIILPPFGDYPILSYSINGDRQCEGVLGWSYQTVNITCPVKEPKWHDWASVRIDGNIYYLDFDNGYAYQGNKTYDLDWDKASTKLTMTRKKTKIEITGLDEPLGFFTLLAKVIKDKEIAVYLST